MRLQRQDALLSLPVFRKTMHMVEVIHSSHGSHRWLFVLALVFGLAGPGPAVSQPGTARPKEKDKGEKDIQVVVVAILGTDRDAVIDRKVKDVAREVQKQHPRLTGFRLATMTSKTLAVGASETFPLVEDQVATVVVQQAADKDNRVRLKIKPPKVGEITYTAVCGKYFPIITRHTTKNGERLILAVMVRPCKDGK